MDLKDLYQESVEKEKRKIRILKSDGSDSGNSVFVIDPFSAKAANISYMFDRIIDEQRNQFKDEHQELHDKCEAEGDYTEFNIKLNEHCQGARDAFVMEIVEGWDFDNEFSKDALKDVLGAFRFPLFFSFQHQIINGYTHLINQHAKK